MLFGQFCCTVKLLYGEERLKTLLEGYCDNKPFVVISDAFPSGYLPMPCLPSHLWIPADSSLGERKRWKKMRWLAKEALSKKTMLWHRYAKSAADMNAGSEAWSVRQGLSHNTIRRDTFTTGTGAFAPFQKSAVFYSTRCELDLYVVLDDEKFGVEAFHETLRTLGSIGFGADASVGLGKFEVLACETMSESVPAARSYLALTACAPQGSDVLPSSYYKTVTYIGRHGSERVFGKSPFKQPILLADAGAVFDCAKEQSLNWLGQGISGHSVFEDTVHQGYAVVLPLLHWREESTHEQ